MPRKPPPDILAESKNSVLLRLSRAFDAYMFSGKGRSDTRGDDAAVIRRVRSFLSNHRYYQTLQLGLLGVCGGAFGLAHYTRRTFILLQPEDDLVLPELGGVRVPYLPTPRPGRQYEDLIDALFVSRRRAQELSGSSAYGPEFYWHMARAYYLDKAIPQHDRFPKLALDAYIVNQKAPYLYCSSGEVAFFLYAWRLLFRHCQRADATATPSGSLSMEDRNIGKGESVWDTPDFWTICGATSPEASWSRSLAQLRGMTAGLGTKPEYAARVLAQWKAWSVRCDGESWLSDWFKLGLLTGENRPRPAATVVPSVLLKRLIEFCLKVDPGNQTIQNALDTVSDALQLRSPSMSWRRIKEVDSVLQEFCLQYLGGSRSKLLELLSQLHQIARFPVLPMYYWTAADGQPKEHFVFPIWETWNFPVPVRVPVGDSWSEAARVASTERPIMIPAVGVCLLALRPWSGAIGSSGVEKPKDTFLRLAFVAACYSYLGRPVIESAFYGTLVADAAVRRGRSEVFHSIPYTLSLSLKYLMNHERAARESGACDFRVPVSMYYIAVEAAMASGALTDAEFHRSLTKIGVFDELLEASGIGEELISRIVEDIAWRLAKERVSRDGIDPAKLEAPNVVCLGTMTLRDSKLSGPEISVFVCLLILLVKEALEHTVRYTLADSLSNRSGTSIRIEIAADSITITNPAREVPTVRTIAESNAEREIESFIEHLSGWRAKEPEAKGGLWIRKIYQADT